MQEAPTHGDFHDENASRHRGSFSFDDDGRFGRGKVLHRHLEGSRDPAGEHDHRCPADAPDYLKTSGKFTTPDRKRAGALGTVPGKDGVRPTGFSLPFDGQPMQGFSGIKVMADGTFWSLSDNGFGNKLNSTDAMLMLHHIKMDWDAGKVEALKTLFLTDPDKKAPFPIVMEGSDKRYLTGADFDVESIQPVADGFWVGEEFGPYILKFDLDGKLTDVIPTTVDGKPVMSPDNPTLTLQADPSKKTPAFNLKRSGGYEGMALSNDNSKLYGLLEGPLWTDSETVEQADGRPALRIIELDVASKAWTGRSWLYPLAEGGEAIGDFNMLDDRTALVIERDNGAGTVDKACADPKAPNRTASRQAPRSSASTRSPSMTAMSARLCARSATSTC